MKRCFAAFLLLLWAGTATAGGSVFEVYGFAMLDAGYNVTQIDPDWFDTVRPTKLPAFENEFGTDGNTYYSVRQTRFGVRSTTPTDLGDLKTVFEWELFGTGVDAGQTTLRLRHAYGELGRWGAGQWWSPFMDIDIFPTTVEYWGPNGMVFFRNVQIRYMPIQGDTRLTIALERPGAAADQGNYNNEVELEGVFPRYPLPDLSAEYRLAGDWGYVEAAGILRRLEWEDMNGDSLELSGSTTGWGVNLSSNIKFLEKDVLRAQVVYGEAIENYMNDATADIAVKSDPGNPNAPAGAEALPLLGIVAFVDHWWSDKFSSSVGYSYLNIENIDGQLASAFHRGHYAIANVLYYPMNNVLTGIELQYGRRENFSDGFASDLYKIQVTFKYNYSGVL